jgi:uncharacterized membrane protein HdeD (DUF308 family)
VKAEDIGSFCIVDPLVPTLALVIVLGFVLLAARITQIVSAFWVRQMERYVD